MSCPGGGVVSPPPAAALVGALLVPHLPSSGRVGVGVVALVLINGDDLVQGQVHLVHCLFAGLRQFAFGSGKAEVMNYL